MEATIEGTKLEELQQNLADRESEYEAARLKANEISADLAELKGNLPGLKKDIEEAESGRQKALSAYVLDKNKLPVLDKAREVLALAKQSEIDAMELLQATERAIPTAQKNAQEAEQKLQGAKHMFWRHVGEAFEAESRELAGPIIEKAWAAMCNSGGASYEGLLRRIFPQPGIERLQEIKKEMSLLHRAGH